MTFVPAWAYVYIRRESAQFSLTEEREDPTQAALAMHGVNAQCLHCLSRGCGYCFVPNLLQGLSEREDSYPGESPIPNVQISARSQCFYDPSATGALCEQRLETHTCKHKRPLFIDSRQGCYEAEANIVNQVCKRLHGNDASYIQAHMCTCPCTNPRTKTALCGGGSDGQD